MSVRPVEPSVLDGGVPMLFPTGVQPSGPGVDARFCRSCGHGLVPGAAFCDRCGTPVAVQPPAGAYPPPPGYSDKTRLVAGILGITLGGLGVHRFYLGFTTIGIIQIVVTLVTCGLGALWGFIEGIVILCGGMDRDAQGRLLRES